MNMMEVKGVTKKFGKFTALNGIDLELKKGEVYGFIGPNGAGKSTTIRVLLGIIQATSGTATIFGKDAWKDAVEIHRKVAYLPGDVQLWENLTGGEIIDTFLKLRGGINKTKRDALIERFQIDPRKKAGTYSKGNRQKIALIAAFASDADLFILDEPTSGLDPLMENIFQQCVEEVKYEGKSVLLSSHILSEVEKLCDRVGIIRQGEMIETGTLDELRHLTRTNIIIETEKSAAALSGQSGIHQFTEESGVYSFQVDPEKLSNVMQKVGELGIKRIESTPPTLEDLFMRHYETDSVAEKG
ncbi:ATP-binding cassette domain-containing protein [Gracilibacillus salitolerans]|uniref:ATP-binding cassette domain-containing protein n=1 Tax=Gracilibacillus salitolerans TaxID=2663022 RepID=A0A5Q2TH55_9BACI|nr:ABC transporter ATP-binding protein [Gracilibacillus salitolerans]QGH33363.1 ATP-binding cassette domain-containing protein [Gracilibacillus salitolerans]